MKNTSKILALVLIVMTLLMSLTAITASATKTTGDTVIYLSPNTNWQTDNARYALYTWDVSTNWYDMTDTNGDGIYECTVPAGVENIIFCRMNPSTTTNNWDNKWNQTADLTYDGTNNHYTVTEGTWDKGGGTWTLLELGECIHTPTDEGTVVTSATCTENGEVSHVCSKCGETYSATILATGHTYVGAEGICSCGTQVALTVAGEETDLFGTAWDVTNNDNNMTFDAETGLWSISYTNSTDAEIWAHFKVVQDHGWNVCWGGAAAGQTDSDNAYVGVPAGYVLTITFDYATNKLSMTTAEPHVHSWSDATCTEPAKCECGETNGEALGHSYTEGTCSVCGEADPDYVAPQSPAKDVYVNISALENGTTTGEELVAGTGISASAGLTIEENGKDIDGFKFTTRLKLGGTMKVSDGAVVAGIQIVTDGPGTLVVYAISGSSSATRTLRLCTLEDGALVDVATDDTVAGDAIGKYVFEIPAAGTYYLGSKSSGINLYYLAVNHVHTYSDATCTAPKACACGATDGEALGHSYTEGTCSVCGEADPDYVAPHVNTLVVGDTNKIVIGDSAVDNGFGYLVESVLFVADEKAHYEFTGEGLTILVYDLSMNNLCGLTGKADLEAGTYIICIAANTVGTKGEYNVAVTKSEIVVSEHVNKLVVGENNKIVVDGSAVNQNGNPIAWVPFVADEKAVYTFASETEGALVYIFNADYSLVGGALVSSAILEPGNYIICVGNGAVGDIYVTVTKSEVPTECEHNYVYMNCTLCGAANPNFAHNILSVGENKVVCNEYHLVDTTGHGNPYQFTLLTVAEDGLYIFTCDKLIGVTIFTTEINDPNADFAAGTGTSWALYEAGKAELKAGTYYIGFIYVDGVGEYTVNIEKHDQHDHKAVVTEPTCTEAGYTTHTCVCGDTYTDSEVAALGHDYVEGVCSRCEAKNPDYVAPQPPVDENPDDGNVVEPVQLNFFQKIIKLIKDLIAKFLGFFKRFGI